MGVEVGSVVTSRRTVGSDLIGAQRVPCSATYMLAAVGVLATGACSGSTQADAATQDNAALAAPIATPATAACGGTDAPEVRRAIERRTRGRRPEFSAATRKPAGRSTRTTPTTCGTTSGNDDAPADR